MAHIFDGQIDKEQIEAMIDDMTELVTRQQADLKFTFVNKAFLNFIGKNAEAILELDEMDLIHPEDRERLLGALKSFSPENPMAFLTARYKKSSGEYAWVEWTARAFFDQNGRFLAYQAVGRDITEHVEAKEVLRNAKVELERRVMERTVELNELVQKLDSANNYLGSILRHITEGVVVVDEFGNLDFLNSVLEQEWGHSADAFKEKLRDDIVARKISLINKMFDENRAFIDMDFSLSIANQGFPCLMSGTPILLGDSKGLINKKGILVFKPIKKVHSLVNRLSGAFAKYVFDDIVTNSKEMLKIIEEAKFASHSDGSVIIEGESGTGKEIFAQAIHNESSRRKGPFIAVNCGAIPRDLISSELFGYVEGSFTGAKKGGKPGKFELASGGTIFLDEIGDMPFEQQVALLRVIQEKSVIRIGAHEPIPVDVRIICATNKNLFDETKKENFRLDLYYRLNVFNLIIPPLRQRKRDIPVLFMHFLKKNSKTMNPDNVNPQIFERLKAYDWPGNVRELQNVVERMVYFSEKGVLTVDNLPDSILLNSITLPSLPKPRPQNMEESNTTVNEFRMIKKKNNEESEMAEIMSLLDRFKGNVSEVARNLGISRSTLYRKMKIFKIYFPKDE